MHTLSPYSGPPSARAAASAAASWWSAKRAAFHDALARALLRLATAWPMKAATRIAVAIAAEQTARRAAAELKSWDERMLRDIGLARMDVDAAVRGERGTPWRRH